MNLKQHSFITEYLRHRDHVVAYKNAYQSTSDYRTIESAANRLLRQPEIAQAIQDAMNSIRAEVEEELKQELKTELLTLQKKRELLAKIAMGEQVVEQNFRGKNCSQCTQFIKPTINQMLKAIDLDSKLAGHYGKQKKHEPTHTVIQQKESQKDKMTINTTQQSNVLVQPAKTIPMLQNGLTPRSKRNKNSENHNKTQQLIPHHHARSKQAKQMLMKT